MREADFRESSQIVKFVDVAPVLPNDVISYIIPNDIPIKDGEYTSGAVFATKNSTYEDNDLVLPVAGYVRIDDVTATAYNRGNSDAGKDITVTINSITPSRVEGSVKFNLGGETTVSINVIAVGQPNS